MSFSFLDLNCSSVVVYAHTPPRLLIWLVAIFEGTLAHSNCLSSMLPSKEGQAGLDVMVGTWLCEQRRYLSLAL